MGAGGERGELLVAHLHELDLVADLVEGEVEPVAAVAGVAVDAPDAPRPQALEHEDRDVGSAHARALPRALGDHPQVLGEGLALRLARRVVAGAQDGRRVDGGHDELGEVGLDRPATRLGEPEALAEQRLGRGRAEQEQRARLDDVELGPQPRQAGVDLALARLLVDAALAALLELEVLDDVGDVDVGAVDADRLQRLVELAARGPDEDPARRGPRGRPGISPTIISRARLGPSENTVWVAGRVEVAAAAAGGRLAQRLEALALGQERRRVPAGVLGATQAAWAVGAGSTGSAERAAE